MIKEYSADLKSKVERHKILNGNDYLFSDSYTSSDEES